MLKVLKQVMSRVERYIDNGPMEGFWRSLKSESYYWTYEELEADITEYINFYNTKRLEKINSLSPLEYRSQAALDFILFKFSTW